MRRSAGRATLEDRRRDKNARFADRIVQALVRQRRSLGFWIFIGLVPLLSLLYSQIYGTLSIAKESASVVAFNFSRVVQNYADSKDTDSIVPAILSTAPGVTTGARFPNGTEGYIADPESLKKEIYTFVRRSDPAIPIDASSFEAALESQPELYWNAMTDYQAQYRCENPADYWRQLTPYPGRYENCSTYSGFEILSAGYACDGAPGQGFEGQGGYKLLTEKIRVYGVDTQKKESPATRILCAVYTYHRMRDLTRSQAISWGHKCDGFLAFSTETIPELGMLELIHDGQETYDNMWQKTRSIWAYIARHYLYKYDFFHLGGDDMYLIVENLRHYLSQVRRRQGNDDIPVYLGQWIPKDKSYFVGGAPGYTMNRAALARLVDDVLPVCKVNARVSWEDRTISNCFRETMGLAGGDTRDVETGEQTYHDCGPDHLYTFRSTTGKKGSFHAKTASFWESLHHPNPSVGNSSTVGSKHELEAAATLSVNLHDLYHPLYVTRVHSILYRRTCSRLSALGRALQQHT